MIVIADDITGAAEIAGIGLRFGLRVHLAMYTGEEEIFPSPDCDLLVYATDTRSLSEDEAITISTRLGKMLNANGQKQIFKKTDSVLRGHIVSELNALMETIGVRQALLLPQNPSRERIIHEGIYYINNIPLNETSFSYDPEFPATTANIVDYFNKKISLLPPREQINANGIHIVNASTPGEVMFYASSLTNRVLPAGGADFFTHYLLAKGYELKDQQVAFNGLGDNESIIVCGSTSKHLLSTFGYIRRKEIPAYNMPEDVFWGESPTEWINQLKEDYWYNPSLILQINHPPQEGRAFASRLRQIMGEVTTALLSEHLPQELIIEGGATAFTILGLLKWNNFKVKQEVSPGVIRITPTEQTDITITLKPGSYPWGELFQ